MSLLNSGLAAVVVLGSSFGAKMYMTLFARFKMLKMSKDELKAFESSREYINASKAQLNEAEFAPVLTAMLLYLHTKNVASPIASTTVAVGQVYLSYRYSE